MAAAAEPITREQLNRWGIPTDRLSFALLDLHDFLRSYRGTEVQDHRLTSSPEPRYALAHEEFRRFLQEDAELALSWRTANAFIGQRAVEAWRGRWTDVDPIEAPDLYDLRFVLHHLYLARLPEAAEQLQQDSTYASACIEIASGMCASADIRQAGIALELAGHAVEAYERDVVAHRAEIVRAEEVRGMLLAQLGLLDQAISSYDHALEHSRAANTDLQRLLSPPLARIYLAKGIALERLGRPYEAMTNFDAAAIKGYQLQREGDPNARDLLHVTLANRGQALRLLGRLEEAIEAHEEAAAILEEAASHESDGPGVEDQLRTAQALTQMGALHFDIGEIEEAVRSHERALALIAEQENSGADRDVLVAHVVALVNRGVALEHLGRVEDALDSYGEAVARGKSVILNQDADQIVDAVLLALT